MNYFGSIDLTAVPKELFKRVTLKNGEEHVFLNIKVFQRKEPVTFGNRTYTHFVSCAPKKEEQKEGVKYIIGDMTESDFQAQPAVVTPDQVNNAPSVSNDGLPF